VRHLAAWHFAYLEKSKRLDARGGVCLVEATTIYLHLLLLIIQQTLFGSSKLPKDRASSNEGHGALFLLQLPYSSILQ
jgi:hypothetical protein